MKYIYGPVQSRRLGYSLGITLTPQKVCSFDCIYCQLGRTPRTTSLRKEYIPVREIVDELKLWRAHHPQEAAGLSYITFSGFGEPTLHAGIAVLIDEIKQVMPGTPLALITNASMLSDPGVRQEIGRVDLLVPSLDAVTQKVFERIDRPQPGITVDAVITGLREARKGFAGKFWLEVMLVSGVNDDLRHIKKLKAVVDELHPDKVQLNSPVRTTADSGVMPVRPAKLKKIKELLGENCEII